MNPEEKKVTYDDYLDQIRKVREKGSVEDVLKEIPGAEKLNVQISEEELDKTEKMILAMTDEERQGDVDIDNDRRQEIADQANVDVEDVHRLIRGFARVRLLLGGMRRFQK